MPRSAFWDWKKSLLERLSFRNGPFKVVSRDSRVFKNSPSRAHAKGVVLFERRVSASKCLLESPFLEPLQFLEPLPRTLLRTLPSSQSHCKTPSKNRS